MKKAEANEIKAQLEKICKDNNLWFEIVEKNKPDLKDIIITVSVRVMEK